MWQTDGFAISRGYYGATAPNRTAGYLRSSVLITPTVKAVGQIKEVLYS